MKEGTDPDKKGVNLFKMGKLMILLFSAYLHPAPGTLFQLSTSNTKKKCQYLLKLSNLNMDIEHWTLDIYYPAPGSEFLILYLFSSSTTSRSFISAPSITNLTIVRTLWRPVFPAAPGLICKSLRRLSGITFRICE